MTSSDELAAAFARLTATALGGGEVRVTDLATVSYALKAAHRGLLRALDFQTASPHGLAIKADVRAALRTSGFRGPLGEVDA